MTKFLRASCALAIALSISACGKGHAEEAPLVDPYYGGEYIPLNEAGPADPVNDADPNYRAPTSTCSAQDKKPC